MAVRWVGQRAFSWAGLLKYVSDRCDNLYTYSIELVYVINIVHI